MSVVFVVGLVCLEPLSVTSHFYNITLEFLLQKYVVVHRVATTYHPKTNRQIEFFNKEIKQVLQKVVQPNRKD